MKEEEPGEGLFPLSAGSIWSGSEDAERSVLMICLGLSSLLQHMRSRVRRGVVMGE